MRSGCTGRVVTLLLSLLSLAQSASDSSTNTVHHLPMTVPWTKYTLIGRIIVRVDRRYHRPNGCVLLTKSMGRTIDQVDRSEAWISRTIVRVMDRIIDQVDRSYPRPRWGDTDRQSIMTKYAGTHTQRGEQYGCARVTSTGSLNQC